MDAKMQPTLDGYRVLDTLRRSANRVVYLAVRESDQRKVVAKVYSIVGASDLEDRVKHEFELIRALDLRGVVRALELERRGTTLVLLLDWFDGVSLEQHCRGRALGLDECLRLAHDLAEILATVHERRVIHRDIKPANILIAPHSGEVVLADFGISVLLESERGRIHDPDVLEGTLPFLSPEQTGRTGRGVDFRSDLYSLGVTIYELLTGQRPFTESTPLELIHAHLARRPAAPRSLRPELPNPVSALVMKLLEKAPERRYQSARALAQDLAQLIDRRRRSQSLDDFELGHGTSSVLQLPHGLYGRAAEREQLLALLREAATGTTRMAIVQGPPGIGKSALIDELGEPIIARQGLLARGKFEGDTVQPMSAILQAISSLADQLLTEPDHRLAVWRQQLETELGSLATVIIALVPKFAAIIGATPSSTAESLTVIESRNRVVHGLTRLLSIIARPQHPLVLALDDLQWADPASVEFIVELLLGQHPGLLVIATSRNHAVDAAQIQELKAKLRDRELLPLTITLAPLDEQAISELICDALSMTSEEVAGLVPIIRRKTGNNPFFARQFLLHLSELELLRVGPRGWTWNTAELDAATLPEDSLELMTDKLGRIDPAARWLLEFASVFGLRFQGLAVIAVANAHSGELAGELACGPAQLHALIDEGLIFGIEGDYQFAHGRIREAAYTRLDARTCRRLHLRVGEYLLASLDDAAIEGRVFELVAHLDRGHGLSLAHDAVPTTELERVVKATDADTRERLARLNLRAGEQAMAAGAPKSARRYLEIGVGLSSARLPALDDPDHARVYVALHALASARMLAGDLDAADELLEDLLGQPLTPGEYGALIQIRCSSAFLRGDTHRAVQIGVEGLRGLGVGFPARVNLLSVIGSIVALIWTMRGSPLERLDPEPVRDPRARAAIELAGSIGFFAYFGSPQTWVVIVQRHVALVMRHGSHPTALLAITSAALLVSIALGNRHRSRMLAIAEAALELDARLGPNIRRHSLLLSASSLRTWTTSPREMGERHAACVKLALEAGDLTSASFHSLGSVTQSFLGGDKLPALHERCVQHQQQVLRWGTQGIDSPAIQRVTRVFIHGPIPQPGELEPIEIPYTSEGLGTVVAYEAQLFAAQLLYLFGRRAEALQVLDVAGPQLERYMRGTHVIPPLVLFVGLAAAAAIPRLRGRARRQRARQLQRSVRRFLRGWRSVRI
jgi:serine/threonine protein kinase